MLMGIVFISFPFALPAKRCSCTPAMSVPIFCTVVINQICSFRQFNRQQCHFIVYSPLNQRRTHICCKALLHACIRGSLEKPQQQFTSSHLVHHHIWCITTFGASPHLVRHHKTRQDGPSLEEK